MLDFLNAKVVEIVNETSNTKRFYLEVQAQTVFDFKPGQFITLDLPIHEKKNKRLRSYSIASAPNGTNIIELVIVLMPGGLGTTYLFNEVQVGSIIPFRGALGHFLLPETNPVDLYFICTGTGIAPFRSMIHYLIHTGNIHNQNITLISGVRTQADLLYHKEMQELAAQHNWLRYLPTLSREQWSGATGYVHKQYQLHAQQKPAAEFMLCGWRNMVDEARTTIEQMGINKKQIHFELYG